MKLLLAAAHQVTGLATKPKVIAVISISVLSFMQKQDSTVVNLDLNIQNTNLCFQEFPIEQIFPSQ